MPVKPVNLQDNFLNQMRRENKAVSIHLLNGFQMKGYVRGFDNFTVVLEISGKQHLIYKHAISTVAATKLASAGEAEKRSE